MSIRENFEDFNYAVKDSYYQLEGKIGFPPVIILALVVVGIIAFFYLSQPPAPVPKPIERVTATLVFKDRVGNYIGDLLVSFETDGNSVQKKTSSRGKVSVKVKKNSSLRVSVKDGAYKEFKKTYSVRESNLKDVVVLQPAKEPLKVKHLRFEDEKGLIRGKPISAVITCRDGRSFIVRDEEMDGLIDVTLPEGCIDIKVKANLSGYEEVETGYFGDETTRVITLKKKEIPKGRIRFRLEDDRGRLMTGKNFAIRVRGNGNEKTKKSDGYAIVEFKNLPVGNYSVSITDESGDWVVKNLPGIASLKVEKDAVTEQRVVFSRQVKGTIKVTVKDKATGKKITNANVLLADAIGNKISELDTGDNGESVTFSLYEEGIYRVTAKKEGEIGTGYFPKTVDVNDLNSEVTIALEKVTEQNIGRTIVRVKDEDGRPVRDAKIMFRYKDNEAIVELTEKENYKLSDANGEAEFYLGGIEGAVYPYVVKYPAKGGTKTQAKEIKPLELNEFNVTMVVGNSTLKLKTIDSSGVIVPETFFEVFTVNGDSLGKVPMTDGEYSYEIKADKKVYLVFSKEGYMDYQSKEMDLWPDETFEVTAVMRRVGEILEPSVEFKGAFENNQLAESLRAGGTYEFRFTVVFPNNKELDKAGFHFRVGEKQSVEDDSIYITKVNAPNNDSEVKGITYTPPAGEASEEPATTRAKWTSIEWFKPQSGVYNVSFKVKVKDNTFPNTKLPVYYRAWSVKKDEFVRTPVDEELGSKESIEGKNTLYAKTFEQVYFEGSKPFCNEDFCITGDWLYDKQEDIFQKKPYSLMVLGDYNFMFKLLNNSKQSFNETRIMLKNRASGDEKQDLKIKSFIFRDADGNYIRENVEDYSFSLSDVGNFVYPRDVNFNIALSPKNPTDTQLLLQLIGNKNVVFEKSFDFHILVAGEMKIDLEPGAIKPFEAAELTVKLSEKSNSSAISGAIVTLTRESPDGLFQVLTETSDEKGEAKFSIPASIPLTKLEIGAEKTGFVPESTELVIGKDVLSASPKSLSSSLNMADKREEELNVTISNKSGADFLIKNLSFRGDFKGILNEAAMDAYLSNWVGAKIGPNSDEEFVLLKTILAANAEAYLKAPESLKGELEVTLYNPEFFAEYALTIPVNIDVSIGGMPDNSPCVNIDGKDVPDWSATILNNRAVTEFEVYNACIKEGKKITVENLEAKLEWDEGSKKAGILELTVTNPDGQTVSEVLRPGEWTALWPKMTTDTFGNYSATLTFTPKTGYLNETAKFRVYFDAETNTDQGRVKVNGEKVKLNGTITNLNLNNCISMPAAGEKVEIAPDKEEATFELDASKCNSDVLIELCMGDPYCKGGTKEGGIRLSNRQFTLQKSSPKQTITVYREEIPGLYGIPVYARLPNTSLQKVKTIDVLVEPKTSEWFSLNRYEAILSKETGWKDTLKLVNRDYLEEVKVNSTECQKCKNPKNLPEECVFNRVFEKRVSKKSKVDDPALLLSGITTAATVYGTISSSTISLTIFGVTCGPPCWAAMAAAAIVGVFWSLSTSGPNCDIINTSYPFQDYVINLAGGDLKSLQLSDVPFTAKANTSNPELSFSDSKETIAIEIENTTHQQTAVDKFAVLSVSATEHIHGDPTHKNPEVTLTKPNFEEFNIPDTTTKVETQKFHLKFKTKQSLDLKLPPLGESYSCVDGTKIGVTGPNARPKISFNWDFSENGLKIDECDIGGKENYCDATQLSIEISKKIHKIDEFLKENAYSLKCPVNPTEKMLEAYITRINNEKSTHVVESSTIGLKRLSQALDKEAEKATITAVVENKTGKSNNATVKIMMARGSDYRKECQKTVEVSAGSMENISCTFDEVEESSIEPYFANAVITSAQPGSVDNAQLTVGFLNKKESSSGCWLPFSTSKIEGNPAIIYFIDKDIPGTGELIKNYTIKWPSDWPGSSEEEKIEYLRSLFDFKANLIKDGYGADFQEDFAEYYSGHTFFDVPSWFYSGSNNQLADYYKNPEKLKFKEKYGNGTTLPGPGTYQIYITIDFGENDWSLYRNGEPKGKITIEFYKLSEPKVNSVFYYLPFDGLVGLKSQNGRQGYGVNYINKGKEIELTKSPAPISTKHSPASHALETMSTVVIDDFKYLNSSAASRGNLLSLEVNGDESTLVFSPSYATPVILKTEHEKSTAPFYSEFTVLEDEQPKNTGCNASYWTGLGKCADFTGQPVQEVFNFTPDERSGENSYKVKWSAAPHAGNVFLYSVFYTPSQKSYALKAESDKASFISPDEPATKTIGLNGIKGMQFNYKGSEPIISIERILKLVESGHVCISSSGSKSSFWWNPKKLKETKGSKLSVSEFEQSLVAGKTCIGPEK